MKLSIGEPDDIAVGRELSVDNGFEDSAPETSDSDNPDSDAHAWVARALRSPPAALIPCCVPVTRAARTVCGSTGGNSPNGVGTSAGPVD